jgi:hypothetical protein
MSHLKSKYVKAFGGGEEKKVIPETKTTKVVVQPNFDAWGDLAEQAKGQGWYPSVDNKGVVEYRNGYQNQFNQVVIPNDQKRGYISVVGRKGSPLSVYIKKADGTIDRTLLQNVTPQQVDAFFRSQQSTIQKRNDAIVAGTNTDRIMPNGSYTPLQ